MQIEYLVTFCAVVQEGSFSSAARRLHLAQPTVSQQVGAVEDALGFRLLDRGRKPVALTVMGRRLYPHIEASVRAFRRAEHLARRGSQGYSELRLAAMYTFGEHVLQHLVARFRRSRPSAVLSATVGDRRHVQRAVADGAADIGITFSIPGDTPWPATLRCLPLWDEPLHLAVSEDHPWARERAPLPVDRFGESEFILLGPGSATRALIDATLPTSGLRVIMEVGTNEAVRAAIRAGLGAGFISALALEPGLVVVPIEDVLIVRRLVALLPRHPAPPAIVREFLSLLREVPAMAGPAQVVADPAAGGGTAAVAATATDAGAAAMAAAPAPPDGAPPAARRSPARRRSPVPPPPATPPPRAPQPEPAGGPPANRPRVPPPPAVARPATAEPRPVPPARKAAPRAPAG